MSSPSPPDGGPLQRHQTPPNTGSPDAVSSSPSPPTTSSPPPEKTTTNEKRTPSLPLHKGDLPDHEDTANLSFTQRLLRAFQVRSSGESGRTGIHPLHFLRIIFRSASWASRAVNILWPVVPAAIALRYASPDSHLAIFVLSYLAMVPCANLIGFAGQELGRKMPHVVGVILETM